jgi:hypothetical protein
MALVVVLMSLGTVLGLGLMLALSTMTDGAIAATSHEGRQTSTLAEATAERALADLAVLPSWDDALRGGAVSSFFSGRGGTWTAAGQPVDLDAETARVMCGRASCVGILATAVSPMRPWGANNPQWRVYASGAADQLLGTGPGVAPGFAVAWVGDDGGENDGDPGRDGGPPAAAAGSPVNPGADVVWLRVVAWGPRGSRRELEIAVERDNPLAHTGLRVRTWREVRGARP